MVEIFEVGFKVVGLRVLVVGCAILEDGLELLEVGFGVLELVVEMVVVLTAIVAGGAAVDAAVTRFVDVWIDDLTTVDKVEAATDGGFVTVEFSVTSFKQTSKAESRCSI